MSVPAIGTPAPDFELMTDSREVFRLSAHRGQMVVLYFYPQDDTEGCTLENIEFTDLMPEFKTLKTVVVGISPDTIEKHCTFRDKYNLGVPLASDPDRSGDFGLRPVAAQEALRRRVHGCEACHGRHRRRRQESPRCSMPRASRGTPKRSLQQRAPSLARLAVVRANLRARPRDNRLNRRFFAFINLNVP